MKNFDPLKSRALQALEPIPAWLSSLSAQRALLATRGLHEVTYNGWITVERIKVDSYVEDKFSGPRVPLASIDMDAQTVREQKKVADHIASLANKDIYRSWSETTIRKRINREIKESEDKYWRKQK